MKGKLIVIEGVDGSGKETQSKCLAEDLIKMNYSVLSQSFPRYEKDSSAMVRHYLAGDFGSHPEDISPYVASTFYAADRYAAYQEEMSAHLENGGIVIADRYTTANMVHQAAKIKDSQERHAFLRWLSDYEFGLLGLPRPNLVFFLNIPPEITAELMAERANKITGEMAKDIHESDTEYLRQSYQNAMELAKEEGWIRIDCVCDGKLRSIEDIHQELMGHCLEVIRV